MDKVDRVKCRHVKLLTLPSETKTKNRGLLSNLENEMFRCYSCDIFMPTAWLCLEDTCGFIGCDPKPLYPSQQSSARFHIKDHIQETKKLNNLSHCIYIHPKSLMIYCFECDIEIFDFELEQGNSQEQENLVNPATIRECFASAFGYVRDGSLRYVQSLKNAKNYIDNSKGLTGLINLGNTSHINAMVQMMAYIPSIKSFYKAVHKRVNKDNYLPPGSAKKVSYLLAELISNTWSGMWRVYKPSGFVQAFFDLFPTLKGYGYKDIHHLEKINFLKETFRYFINAIHEEHRILIPKAFELGLKSCVNSAPKPDEWDVIRTLVEYLENSIVTDTFQGKMFSCFQCDKCRQELQLEDYFTYLELRFPKNRDTERLKKWNILLDSNTKKELNLREDVYHIYDCIVDFFDIKYIRPYGNLYCEKCLEHTPYQKSYRFINLPNVLALHVKREGLDPEDNPKLILPVDNLDLIPFIKHDQNYKQFETRYELIGFIENLGTDDRPEYVTTAKNTKTNQWVTMKDHEIIKRDEKSIVENYATMMFYKKKLSPTRLKEANNLKSQMKLMGKENLKFPDSKLVYIPNYWLQKAVTLSHPGMLHTWHLLCKHGKVKPSYFDCFVQKQNKSMNASTLDSSFVDRSFLGSPEDSEETKADCTTLIVENQSVKLPQEIAEYFQEKYGGGPLIKNIEVCIECLEEALVVKERRRKERRLVQAYDSKKTDISYAVCQEWIDDWKNFLYVNNRFLRRNFVKGHAVPSEIDNTTLADHHGNIKLLLERNVHYRTVNAYIWKIFMELYGGGPEIKLNGKDIYQNYVKDSDYKVELPPEDIEKLRELKAMLNKGLDKEEKVDILPKELIQSPGKVEESTTKNNT